MSASALMNISYGSRRGAKSEKPLAVVKPQQNEIRFFNPTSTAPHTQEQQWYANKINKLGVSRKEGGEPPSDTANRTGARKKSSAPSSRVSFSCFVSTFHKGSLDIETYMFKTLYFWWNDLEWMNQRIGGTSSLNRVLQNGRSKVTWMCWRLKKIPHFINGVSKIKSLNIKRWKVKYEYFGGVHW